MSSLLYSLGRWSFRRRGRVLAAWVLLLGVLGGGALLFSQGTDNSVSIPGTESQAALDQLSRTFPQTSGASAQVVVVAADGDRIDDDAYVEAIDAGVERIADVDGVAAANSPFGEVVSGLVADDDEAAIIQVQFEDGASTLPEAVKDAVTEAGDDLAAELPAGAVVTVGGQAYSTAFPHLSIVEAIGLVVALLVLLGTFRSFLAAGMPLLTALLGIGISIALIYLSTVFGSISSTTPMLALMLGLAVGIDYALFIISRHLQLLRDGVEPEESAARATATAGSAVIFAGITVMIALVGLSLAGIPFLAVMGIAASVAVLVAVAIAVTLTPALLGFAGARLAPSPRARSRAAKRATREPGRFFRGWVRAATRLPALTIALVIGILGVATLPAMSLRLALPDAGMLPEENQARETYDVVSEHFGAGFNGPLIVTGTIVTSDDPLGLMADLQREIERLAGVDAVLLATPNETADTGIIQVVPEGSPDSQETADLVERIRSMHDDWLDEYGVDLSVTGQTAVGIDVSNRLGGALLPFGIFVVGLSLVLLAMVFRSIAVPIKAALGYLLSIGVAFGAVAAVFELGIGADLLNVSKTGPVISFLPIILMGVLFGLAMDYEVFLVSRMREDFVHNGGDARRAIESGFVGSAPVVTAAAVIMFAVFAAFVPEGDTNIKPIALGLAVGVFVDAFIVRMTLVPAVMALLGRAAWWMPRWLDRLLPHFDVEGESVGREIALRDWGAGAAIAARGLRLDGAADRDDGPLFAGVDVVVPRGGVLVVESAEQVRATALLLAIAGRLEPDAGDLKVAGLLLPARAAAVRARVGLALLATAEDPGETLADALAGRPRIVVVDGSDAVIDPAARRALGDRLRAAIRVARDRGRDLTLVLGTGDASRVLALLPDDLPVTTVAVPATASLERV